MNKKEALFIQKKKEDINHHSELSLRHITKPITILLGPNGSGKSMSMKNMKYQLEDKKMKYSSYSTSKDDIVSKASGPFGDWAIEKIACAFISEGERMNHSIADWMCGPMMKDILTDRDKPIYIFIDEMDSGLSIDKIMEETKDILFVVKEELKQNRDIHFIISCNSYELAEALNTEYTEYIWLPTKQRIKLGSYNRFKQRYVEFYKEMFKDGDEL